MKKGMKGYQVAFPLGCLTDVCLMMMQLLGECPRGEGVSRDYLSVVLGA